ncbi:MAG: hypothetical protein ACYSWU_29620, partial [Planctomycetota bacterium]
MGRNWRGRGFLGPGGLAIAAMVLLGGVPATVGQDTEQIDVAAVKSQAPRGADGLAMRVRVTA